MTGPDPYTCPVCGATSWHPQDAEHGYCGRCHAFTGEAVFRVQLAPCATWQIDYPWPEGLDSSVAAVEAFRQGAEFAETLQAAEDACTEHVAQCPVCRDEPGVRELLEARGLW